MCMYRKFYLLVFCILGLLLLPTGAQPTTTRELYVKPTEDTSCPEPCHTLDEYVHKAKQYFMSNTTFNFLPGNHRLGQSLNAHGVANLALVAINGTTAVNISCKDTESVSLSFIEISNLTLENLTINSCSMLTLTDLLHLNLLGVVMKPKYYSVIMTATNILGTSNIAGFQIIESNTSDLAFLEVQMCYNDQSTWPRSVYNQLTMKNLILPYPQVPLVYVFEFNQSTYGVNLLLDSLTIMTDRAVWIYLRINKESPNNVTLTDLYFIYIAAALGFQIFVEDFALSNTSMYIRNCTWSSLDFYFTLMSTQVTIEDTLIDYPLRGQFSLRGQNRRPFVMNNVTFTKGQTDVDSNALTLENTTNVKLINCKFTHHRKSGGLTLQDSVVHLHSSIKVNFTNCEFKNNNVTPIASFDSTFILSGSNIFSNNFAPEGGAMAIYGQSYVTLANDSDTWFVNNTAETVGGAIYIQSGSGLPLCFFLLDNNCWCCASTKIPVPNITVRFDGNVVRNGGSAMYGASLDTCQIGNHSCQGWNYVDSLFHINQRNDSVLSAVTSEPLRACLCNKHGKPSCGKLFRHRTVFPGELFHVSAVVVGDRFGTVDGSVYAQLLPLSGPYAAELGNLEHAQRVTHFKCAKLSYTILSNSSADLSLVLTASTRSAWVEKYPDKDTISYVQESADAYKSNQYIDPLLRSFPIYINITLLPCPLGFTLSGEPYQCVCEPQLQHNHIHCNLTTQTVQRSGTEWVNASFHNNTPNGVIVSKYCPNNYCKQEVVNISLEHPDIQCAFNHSGTLCGGCQSKLSLALGSAQCLQCSNACLALLFPFALAGFALVFFVKLLDLTVTKGTLNGLVFYANIVRANQVAWIPAHHTNVLTVFIAWLNLDLGIETCFFDGLDAYWKTWLQFIFPLYIWVIMILIIVVSHYSSTAAKIFGSNNSVPVLATLFLLSYSKLLRTIISIFQASILGYPDGASATVWSYDGNIPYFSAKRIPLLLVALMVLLFLWLPYTGTLLFAQCLQRSNYKIATMLTKFKPFFDAYFGPLKDSHRYWVGLLLLVRGALFIVYAATPTSMASVDLLATVVAMLCLLVYPPVGYVYRKMYLNLLDNSFLLNLSVLAVGTLYIQGSHGQAALAYTSIGIAFTLFVAVMLVHALASLRTTRLINGLANRYFNIQDPQEANQDRGDYEHIPEEQEANRQGVRGLRVTLNDYREPVLKYLDDQ